MRQFFKENSKEPIKCPLGDLDVYFDNTQKVGDTTRVKISGTTPMSIVTNVIYVKQENVSEDVKRQSELKPSVVWTTRRTLVVICCKKSAN